MNDLRYHETLIRMLEQGKFCPMQKALDGIKRHEEITKSNWAVFVRSMPRVGINRCYCEKLYCCCLLLRGLNLYLEIEADESEKIYRQVLLMELVESLESIYSLYRHFA